jgi:methionyl-tRNA formyltransferase
VEAKLATAAVPLVARALRQLAAGTLTFREQDDAAATYCRKLDKADGAIDFTAPAPVLAARINGLFPWPGCAVEINGQNVKLGLADFGSAGGLPGSESGRDVRAPGTVLGADQDGLLVATGDGVLRLRRLQRPGGRMLGAAEFLRGFDIAAGTVLPSHAMTALVTTR